MMQLKALVLGTIIWALPFSAASAFDRTAAINSLNALRADKRLSALTYSPQLEKIAQRHANDMLRNDFRSHTGSDGSTIGSRLNEGGYGWCAAAENIAWGQRNLKEVMNGWNQSRGHRKNMLNRKVSEFALVRVAGDIWVMVLAKPGC